MNIREFLDRMVYKDDLKQYARDRGIPVGGAKAALVERLLNEGAIEIIAFLNWLLKDDLKHICDSMDLRVGGSKEDLGLRILNSIEPTEEEVRLMASAYEGGPTEEYLALWDLETPPKVFAPMGTDTEPVRAEPPPPPTHKRPLVEPTRQAPSAAQPQGGQAPTELLNAVVKAVEAWIPQKRYSGEEGYRVDLNGYLARIPGFHARQERGDTLADIVVNGVVPIEVKKNPNLAGYDRLLGQLVRHRRATGVAVAVVCDVRRLEQFQDFQDNLNTTIGMNGNVVVIVKM